jgi:urease accessory protein
VLHLSGGLLDGDETSIDVSLEPGARLALRTQAATQAHAGRSKQTIRVTVGEGAWFSYVPHALVPHARADHHLQIVVAMAPEAHVLVADALSPGRVEYGESFAYTRVRLDLDVWSGPDLVARERALVQPDPALRRAQFGPATHTGAAYVFGHRPPPIVETHGSTRVGQTELARGGWYVRATSQRATEVDDALASMSAAWWQSCELPNRAP